MNEGGFIGVARQNLLVHHAPEIRAIRALQVFIDEDAHGALGLPFDQWLLSGRRDRQRQKRQEQPPVHMRTGYSRVNVKRVSDGICTRWPLVATCAAVPAPAPAKPPIAAPLPPPAIAPMMAPRAAVPPITFSLLPVRDWLACVMAWELTSIILPSTLTETRSRVSSVRPEILPDCLSSTSLTTTSAPRGITW